MVEEARVQKVTIQTENPAYDIAVGVRAWLLQFVQAGPDDLSTLAGVPTVVVHGTVDPLFPVEHGRALAAAIPGARLLEIAGMGHQLPPAGSWSSSSTRWPPGRRDPQRRRPGPGRA